MKTRSVFKVVLILLTTQFGFLSANAESLKQQIQSGEYCPKKIYEQFKLVGKTNHKNLTEKPTGDLLDHAESGEVMCPWAVQFDFNGDKKTDWVGFQNLNGKYQLVAYLSARRGYKVAILEQDTPAPLTSYLGRISAQNLSKIKGHTAKIGALNYGLTVVNLKKGSKVYYWNGKTLAKVASVKYVL